jgi:hypothetical protein
VREAPLGNRLDCGRPATERRGATACMPPRGGGSEELLGFAANGTVFSMSKEVPLPQPNVELTGRRRCDALAARRMMNQNCLAASAGRRWRSG